MSSRVNWNSKKYVRDTLHPAIAAGLERSAAHAQRKMRINMGSEGGGVKRKTKKGRNVYFASPAGRFPGVRSGFLRRSIVWWRPTSEATNTLAPFIRVGVPSTAFHNARSVGFYAGILERSKNPKMRRPWAMRTIREEKGPMSRIFSSTVAARLRGGG